MRITFHISRIAEPKRAGGKQYEGVYRVVAVHSFSSKPALYEGTYSAVESKMHRKLASAVLRGLSEFCGRHPQMGMDRAKKEFLSGVSFKSSSKDEPKLDADVRDPHTCLIIHGGPHGDHFKPSLKAALDRAVARAVLFGSAKNPKAKEM